MINNDLQAINVLTKHLYENKPMLSSLAKNLFI